MLRSIMPCSSAARLSSARPAPLQPLSAARTHRRSSVCVRAEAPAPSAQASISRHAEAQAKYKWEFDPHSLQPLDKKGRQIMELPVEAIIRPLGRTRGNDSAKVEALMVSIQEVGLKEPIDVLEVDGRYYGFSGCHRYEAHQRLGLPTILCRVRKANQTVLKMHMM